MQINLNYAFVFTIKLCIGFKLTSIVDSDGPQSSMDSKFLDLKLPFQCLCVVFSFITCTVENSSIICEFTKKWSGQIYKMLSRTNFIIFFEPKKLMFSSYQFSPKHYVKIYQRSFKRDLNSSSRK